MLVAATERGVSAISFGAKERGLEEGLHAEYPAAEIVRDDTAMRRWVTDVLRSVEDGVEQPQLPLDIRATAFRRSVWDALRTIPHGETRSYSAIARQVGSPKAARAVGNACHTNPIADHRALPPRRRRRRRPRRLRLRPRDEAEAPEARRRAMTFGSVVTRGPAIAIGCWALFVATVLAMPLLNDGYSPIDEAISYGAIDDYGWVQVAGFFALATGTSILAFCLQPRDAGAADHRDLTRHLGHRRRGARSVSDRRPRRGDDRGRTHALRRREYRFPRDRGGDAVVRRDHSAATTTSLDLCRCRSR